MWTKFIFKTKFNWTKFYFYKSELTSLATENWENKATCYNFLVWIYFCHNSETLAETQTHTRVTLPILSLSLSPPPFSKPVGSRSPWDLVSPLASSCDRTISITSFHLGTAADLPQAAIGSLSPSPRPRTPLDLTKWWSPPRMPPRQWLLTIARPTPCLPIAHRNPVVFAKPLSQQRQTPPLADPAVADNSISEFGVSVHKVFGCCIFSMTLFWISSLCFWWILNFWISFFYFLGLFFPICFSTTLMKSWQSNVFYVLRSIWWRFLTSKQSVTNW